MCTIVAIAVDKIQSLLYYSINSNEQKSQTNSGTLQSIMQASWEISSEFYCATGLEGTQGQFSGFVRERLLTCSGVCIFSVSLNEEDTYAKLKKLFTIYYKKFDGQILLKYAVYQHTLNSSDDKMDAVKQGKQLLKSSHTKSRVVEENQDLFFSPQTVSPPHKAPEKKEHANTYFVKTINELFPQDKSKTDTFRIAVIKVDLDGMGNLFAGIKDYENYKHISKVLNEKISLESLCQLVKRQRKKHKTFRMYPLYAAGDDILFAVPVNDLRRAIDLCKSLVRSINTCIQEKAEDCKQPISASIGIELAYNREPIRYYHNRVQTQLDHAKRTKTPKELEDVSHIKISISNCVVFDYEYHAIDDKQRKSLNKNKTVILWQHLLRTIKYIYGAICNGYQAQHFLFELLQKIQDPKTQQNELKLSNMVLYHLRPRYFEGTNKQLRICELQIIRRLLEQVTVETTDKKSKHLIVFNGETCKKLIHYTRLLLLFTDERFQIMPAPKDILDECHQFQGLGELKRQVFFYPLEYIYETSLSSYWLKANECKKKQLPVNDFRDLIVRKTNPQKNDGLYELLDISPTMLHRFKKTELDICSAADALAANETRSLEEYCGKRREKINARKMLPSLYFDKDAFLCFGKQCVLLENSDYLDALMIFYAYYHTLKAYRRQY